MLIVKKSGLSAQIIFIVDKHPVAVSLIGSQAHNHRYTESQPFLVVCLSYVRLFSGITQAF
jgi:hypothetical protein